MKNELIMIVEDVFYITGRGTIVTGQIEIDKVEIEQMVIVDPEYLPEFSAEIKGIESFRKQLKIAERNEYVGLLLLGVDKGQIKKKMKIYLAQILICDTFGFVTNSKTNKKKTICV